MSFVATAIGGAAVLGIGSALIGANAAENAADTQAGASDRAAELTRIAADQAREDIQTLTPQAQRELSQGYGGAANIIRNAQPQQIAALQQAGSGQQESITSGYNQGINTLQGAQQAGLGAIASGTNTARQDLSQGIATGVGEVEQYAATGEQALQQEAALSGALGPEAQAQAIQAFSESPGQKYLREQQEQALLRNSAAIGGLGGGNVRTALQEQAFGIASTDQQRVLENLRSLAGRGQTAATTQSGLQSQGGAGLAQLAAQQGMTESQLIQQIQSGVSGAQIGQGQNLSNITGQTGVNLANVLGTNTANLANLQAQGGVGLSNLTAGMGTTLANIATGSGTQQAQYAQNAGSAQAAGQLGVANAYQQGIQSLTSGMGLAAGLYGGV